MLLAYFDESGHAADQSIVAMGGWLGTVEAFLSFESRWATLLTKYELTDFHASKIRSISRRQGWPEQRVTDLMTDAVTAVTSGEGLFGLGHAVKVPDYDRVVDGNQWLKETLRSPYHLCCCMSIESAHSWMKRIPEWSNDRLTVVFAKAEELKGDADRCRDKYASNDAYAGRIASVTTGAANVMAGLQAADLHAYETFKYAESHLYGSQPRKRVSYRRLFEETRIALPRYLDIVGLCKYS
jgi:hypothetical protein